MGTDYDVLIIGAGLTGIGTACQLAEAFPQKRVAILERRARIGGTWDLFRYPGIRSDSDMYSLGYRFRPWDKAKVLADGPSIRNYVETTARKYGVDEKIQFGLKTTKADWCSRTRRWTVTALHEASGETRRYSARFVVSATGYYNHDEGFRPRFPGEDRFRGQVIHPQHWPEGLDYTGKKVVVIGSGATAVTLVPSMAGTAAHVTMLQRSPTYFFSVPSSDRLTAALAWILPSRWAFALARKRHVLIQRWVYRACRAWPSAMRRLLLARVRRQLGPDVDMRHFTPTYRPWDERLCAVLDADLLHAVRDGRASIETDEIETFTETGLKLKSGKELEADLIVTATGLKLQMLGGMELRVDGAPRPLSQQMVYKGVLVENLPNFAWIFGYTNASWTLKSDLAGGYINRVLKHMDQHGYDVAVPLDRENCALPQGMLDSLKSGYVQRDKDVMPRQGRKLPWQVLMHYERDRKMLLREAVEDGVLRFEAAEQLS